jgi:hypothetical protein
VLRKQLPLIFFRFPKMQFFACLFFALLALRVTRAMEISDGNSAPEPVAQPAQGNLSVASAESAPVPIASGPSNSVPAPLTAQEVLQLMDHEFARRAPLGPLLNLQGLNALHGAQLAAQEPPVVPREQMAAPALSLDLNALNQLASVLHSLGSHDRLPHPPAAALARRHGPPPPLATDLPPIQAAFWAAYYVEDVAAFTPFQMTMIGPEALRMLFKFVLLSLELELSRLRNFESSFSFSSQKPPDPFLSFVSCISFSLRPF